MSGRNHLIFKINHFISSCALINSRRDDVALAAHITHKTNCAGQASGRRGRRRGRRGDGGDGGEGEGEWGEDGGGGEGQGRGVWSVVVDWSEVSD